MKKKLVWLLAALAAFSTTLGTQAVARSLTKKSYIDCRSCLDLPTNEEIIKCAEKYM